MVRQGEERSAERVKRVTLIKATRWETTKYLRGVGRIDKSGVGMIYYTYD